ncbi:alpha-ketoglutarate-dependent dioxygenase AlkB [Longitalea luteola]|uniref:alpha-ketoglutarate-dependent dioxygenase AlkB n=1 Tax=Longitalea luteola TaxID=2812563 RepID=UPI001A96EA9F|nr:alpha-ketoglutarate-dependent dioxygenase AlkB [Longitalea luteola]
MNTTLTLFDQAPALPEGFYYTPEYITEDEEQQLLAAVEDIHLHPMVFQGYTAKRKVASFGYDYNFTTRQLTKGLPIPAPFDWLIDKVAMQLKINRDQIAELLVTEYPIGAVINWHRDAPPFDSIAGISLAADCMFKLRPYEKSLRSRKTTVSLPVRRRSLYIMQGPARSDWEHSTAPVTAVRYSITLRTLR